MDGFTLNAPLGASLPSCVPSSHAAHACCLPWWEMWPGGGWSMARQEEKVVLASLALPHPPPPTRKCLLAPTSPDWVFNPGYLTQRWRSPEGPQNQASPGKIRGLPTLVECATKCHVITAGNQLHWFGYWIWNWHFAYVLRYFCWKLSWALQRWEWNIFHK